MVRLFLTVFLLFVSVSPCFSQESTQKENQYAQISLFSSKDGVTEDILSGLYLDMVQDWHSYWRTPGDTGLATTFDWSKSSNVKEVELFWPRPHLYEVFGFYTFIYPDDVLFPVKVTPKDPKKPVHLSVEAEVMACHEICVPQTVMAMLDIPVKDTPVATDKSTAIKEAFDLIPQKEVDGLTISNVVLSEEAMVVSVSSKSGFENTVLFVEAGEDLLLTRPAELLMDEKDSTKAMLKVVAPEGVENLQQALEGKSIILTLINKDAALEQEFFF